MDHLIKRQIIDLTLATKRGAFELQHRISRLHQEEILSVLQRVLDEISSDGEVIYIDRLEIRLGRLPLKQIMEAGWVQLLETEIRRQLHGMLQAKEGEESILRRSERSGVFHQWLFSMQHGYLPWNAGRTDEGWYLKVLEAIATDHRIAGELRFLLARDTIVLQRVVRQHSAAFLVPLTEALTAEKQHRLAPALEEVWSMIRTLQQAGWPPAPLARRPVMITAWKKILRSVSASALAPAVTARLRTEQLLAELIRTFFSPSQVRALLQSKEPDLPLLLPVCRQVMEAAGATGWSGSDATYFISDIPLRDLPGAAAGKAPDDRTGQAKGAPGWIDVPAGQTPTGQSSTGVPPDKMQRVDASGPMAGNAAATSPGPGPAHPAAGEPSPAIGEAPPPVAPGGSPSFSTRPADFGDTPRTDQPGGGHPVHKDPVEVLAGEEIFVDNAGVILLHPFLHSFFRLLGYTEGGTFRTPEEHTRALHLIHYLATGETSAHEHELLIAKILCAWPLDEPVDSDVELTAAELAEAGDLLTAAIAQWEKLKHTSHAGLREGFLRRPGKLQVKGQDLHLLVETGSIDMLLDYLPWNLSIIKLPWMKYILRVEWR